MKWKKLEPDTKGNWLTNPTDGEYRVTRDEHGNIISDPNRLDDEHYIVRLIGQVITVSLESLQLIGSLPELKFE